MGKSSPKPPPPPDYAGAAREQGTANLEAARLTARLSNPNISTPLGGQRVTFGRQATNQAAYDAAMKQYQQALQQYEQRGQAPTETTVGGPGGKGGTAQGGQAQPGVPNYLSGRDIQEQMQFAGIGGGPTDMGRGQIGMGPTGMGGGMYGGTTFQPGQQGFTFQGPGGGIGAFELRYDEQGRPIAPDISQFQYMTDLDTPFIEQYLTPEAQATLDAQQRVERAYAGLGEQAIGKVGDIYSQTFRPELSAMQTQLQGYGELPSAPDLAAMGQVRRDISPEALAAAPELAAMGQAAGGPAAPGQIAGADVSGVQGVSYGPQEGQYGFARGFVPAERLQQGVDTRGLTALPTGAGMTAQEAILSRLTPTLTREQAALEQQLANQGLVRGGEAYNAAMQQQYQRANDLITQAALQGISVDAAMRQQGFSERQIQAELANQARMGQFGMGTQQAQLANQAVSQNQAQALAVQQSRNAAQAQDLQQRLAMGQFGREGQQLLSKWVNQPSRRKIKRWRKTKPPLCSSSKHKWPASSRVLVSRWTWPAFTTQRWRNSSRQRCSKLRRKPHCRDNRSTKRRSPLNLPTKRVSNSFRSRWRCAHSRSTKLRRLWAVRRFKCHSSKATVAHKWLQHRSSAHSKPPAILHSKTTQTKYRRTTRKWAGCTTWPAR
jgi:hypothetical protein